MSVFEVILVRIFPHSDWIRRVLVISPYSVWVRENTNQNSSECGQVLHSETRKYPTHQSNEDENRKMILLKIWIKMSLLLIFADTRHLMNVLLNMTLLQNFYNALVSSSIYCILLNGYEKKLIKHYKKHHISGTWRFFRNHCAKNEVSIEEFSIENGQTFKENLHTKN